MQISKTLLHSILRPFHIQNMRIHVCIQSCKSGLRKTNLQPFYGFFNHCLVFYLPNRFVQVSAFCSKRMSRSNECCFKQTYGIHFDDDTLYSIGVKEKELTKNSDI